MQIGIINSKMLKDPPGTKTYLKCINDLNVRPEAWKLVEENIGKTFQERGIGRNTLKRIPITQEIIPQIDTTLKCFWGQQEGSVSKGTCF